MIQLKNDLIQPEMSMLESVYAVSDDRTKPGNSCKMEIVLIDNGNVQACPNAADRKNREMCLETVKRLFKCSRFGMFDTYLGVKNENAGGDAGNLCAEFSAWKNAVIRWSKENHRKVSFVMQFNECGENANPVIHTIYECAGTDELQQYIAAALM